MELSKNKPAWYSHIEKICPWTKFQPPTWLLAPPGPVLVFWPQKNYPCGCCHLKINHPSLHTLKKYASGPSFSLLHGSWLRQDPFSHFGCKKTYPYSWRHLKICVTNFAHKGHLIFIVTVNTATKNAQIRQNKYC